MALPETVALLPELLQEQQIAAVIEQHRPARMRFLRVAYARNCPRRKIGCRGQPVKSEKTQRADDPGKQPVPRGVIGHKEVREGPKPDITRFSGLFPRVSGP